MAEEKKEKGFWRRRYLNLITKTRYSPMPGAVGRAFFTPVSTPPNEGIDKGKEIDNLSAGKRISPIKAMNPIAWLQGSVGAAYFGAASFIDWAAGSTKDNVTPAAIAAKAIVVTPLVAIHVLLTPLANIDEPFRMLGRAIAKQRGKKLEIKETIAPKPSEPTTTEEAKKTEKNEQAVSQKPVSAATLQQQEAVTKELPVDLMKNNFMKLDGEGKQQFIETLINLDINKFLDVIIKQLIEFPGNADNIKQALLNNSAPPDKQQVLLIGASLASSYIDHTNVVQKNFLTMLDYISKNNPDLLQIILEKQYKLNPKNLDTIKENLSIIEDPKIDISDLKNAITQKIQSIEAIINADRELFEFTKKTPLALLDVDDTLIRANGEINVELINALKAQGISKAVLFSTTTFSLLQSNAQSNLSRIGVIDLLKKNGIDVVATIITSTPFEEQIKPIGSFFNNTYGEFEKKTNALLAKNKDLGSNEELKDFKEKKINPLQEKEEEYQLKELKDAAKANNTRPLSKGAMLRHLVSRLPDGANVMLFDDKETITEETVTTIAKEVEKRNIKIHGVQVKKWDEPKSLALSEFSPENIKKLKELIGKQLLSIRSIIITENASYKNLPFGKKEISKIKQKLKEINGNDAEELSKKLKEPPPPEIQDQAFFENKIKEAIPGTPENLQKIEDQKLEKEFPERKATLDKIKTSLNELNPKDKQTFDIAKAFFEQQGKNNPDLEKLKSGIEKLMVTINKINGNNKQYITPLQKIINVHKILTREDVRNTIFFLRDQYKEKAFDKGTREVILDLLDRPSQYCEKFIPLLEELKKNTPDNHQDIAKIDSLITSFKGLLLQLNEKNMLRYLETNLTGGLKATLAAQTHGAITSSTTNTINKTNNNLFDLLNNTPNNQSIDEKKALIETLAKDLSAKLERAIKNASYNDNPDDIKLMINKLTALSYFEKSMRSSNEKISEQFEKSILSANNTTDFFKRTNNSVFGPAIQEYLSAQKPVASEARVKDIQALAALSQDERLDFFEKHIDEIHSIKNVIMENLNKIDPIQRLKLMKSFVEAYKKAFPDQKALSDAEVLKVKDYQQSYESLINGAHRNNLLETLESYHKISQISSTFLASPNLFDYIKIQLEKAPPKDTTLKTEILKNISTVEKFHYLQNLQVDLSKKIPSETIIGLKNLLTDLPKQIQTPKINETLDKLSDAISKYTQEGKTQTHDPATASYCEDIHKEMKKMPKLETPIENIKPPSAPDSSQHQTPSRPAT